MWFFSLWLWCRCHSDMRYSLCSSACWTKRDIASVSEPPDVHAAVCPSKHAMAMHPIVNLGQTLNNMKHRASTGQAHGCSPQCPGQVWACRKLFKNLWRFAGCSFFSTFQSLRHATGCPKPTDLGIFDHRPVKGCGHLIGTMRNYSLDLGDTGIPYSWTNPNGSPHNDGWMFLTRLHSRSLWEHMRAARRKSARQTQM